MLYSVGALERYSHICVFKQTGDPADYWSVICELCPGFFFCLRQCNFSVVVVTFVL